MDYWLLKTEPGTYSWQELVKDENTNWDGVRNYQARNFLRDIKKGDLALIYHSGKEKSVVGIASVLKSGYPDPDPVKKGDWVQIDIQARQSLKSPVSLQQIKAEPRLKEMWIMKSSRLSVMPVTSSQFEVIKKLGAPKKL